MRYLKKFGDFCSGFSCFIIFMHLFRQFMLFKPDPSLEEKLGMKEKLVQLFSKDERPVNFLLLILLLMLIVSIFSSVLLKKIPYLSLIFSLPPMLLVLDLVVRKQIESYPMLVLLLTVFAPLTQMLECLRRDREDGGARIGLAGDVICVGAAAFLLHLRSKVIFLQSIDESASAELNYFDAEIYRSLDTASLKLLMWIGLGYLILVLLRVLMRDVYFIDLALSLVPLGVLIYHLNIGALEFHGEMIVAFALAVTVARAVATFGGAARIRKRSF